MIRETKLRVSTHPPQVCVFNASDEKIFQWVRAYLRYHIQLFSAMGLTEDPASDPIIVFHLGSGKAPFNESRQQIETNFASLTEAERQFIVLENDDKTFSARQVLEVCEQLGVPMVLDYHHHLCRNDGENVYELLPRIFATWKGRKRPPKVHLSSPKSKTNFRAHADYIDLELAWPFLRALMDYPLPYVWLYPSPDLSPRFNGLSRSGYHDRSKAKRFGIIKAA